MAAQPDENKPLRSEDSDQDANNKQEEPPKVVVVDASQQKEAQAAQPNEAEQTTKDAQDYANEVGSACNKCYNWFPIGIFGFIGGWLLIACCIIDIIMIALTLTELFVVILLMFGALLYVVVEMPPIIVRKQRVVQRMQLSLYEWLKMLSRMWGKAIYCAVLVVMCFSEMGGGFRWIPWIAGMYFNVLIILYLIFGLLAAKKYNGLFVYISKTEINVNINVGVNDAEEQKENEQEQWQPQAVQNMDDVDGLKQKFAQKFDEIDEDHDGNIVAKDIARLAVQANLELSNSECHAIACYLDNDCIGVVSKQVWVNMWLKNPRLVWL